MISTNVSHVRECTVCDDGNLLYLSYKDLRSLYLYTVRNHDWFIMGEVFYRANFRPLSKPSDVSL